MKRRPKLDGHTRPQTGWSKRRPATPAVVSLQGRRGLPGLHWTAGSVLDSGDFLASLERLRILWVEHGNPGALRDAIHLCSEFARPPQPLPPWAIEAIGAAFESGELADRWRRYQADMTDLRRLDLFEIARAHGLSRGEAGQFVIDCEAGEGRPIMSVARLFKILSEIPKRAAQNPGRYYTASVGLPAIRTPLWDDAIRSAQRALDRRTGARRLFVRADTKAP